MHITQVGFKTIFTGISYYSDKPQRFPNQQLNYFTFNKYVPVNITEMAMIFCGATNAIRNQFMPLAYQKFAHEALPNYIDFLKIPLCSPGWKPYTPNYFSK